MRRVAPVMATRKPPELRVRRRETVRVGNLEVTNGTANSITFRKTAKGVVVTNCCLEEQGVQNPARSGLLGSTILLQAPSSSLKCAKVDSKGVGSPGAVSVPATQMPGGPAGKRLVWYMAALLTGKPVWPPAGPTDETSESRVRGH